ncbi:hypothetical protein HDU84_007222 [Entophlyctis sp. JEL0112]|nr:hypothetical protein HDU84_007222 [Entophlyctis sp. JEL0112]
MIDAVCARFENVVYLNNKVVTVDGVRFIGSTLWSNILPEHKDEIHMRISDYHYIYHTPKKRITPDDTLAEFIKSKTFIESAISAAVLEGLWPVVLTHHVPWTVGTSDPCYNGDALNSAFSSSLPASCDQVQLWCCGDTHYNFRHTLAGYRLLSNQLGYGGGNWNMDVDPPRQDTLSAPGTFNWDLLPVRGRLYIKIVEARNLWAPAPPAGVPASLAVKKPYCVVEYDKLEFVTREAIVTNLLSPEDSARAYQEALQSYGKCSAPNTSSRGMRPHPLIPGVGCVHDVSRPESAITVSVWDRNNGYGEVFLGMMQVVAPVTDGKIYDHWFRLMPRQWEDKIRGDIRIQIMFKTVEKKTFTVDDFSILKLVGKGSYGRVMLVKKKDTGRVYAMKILSKKDIVKKQEIEHTLCERNVLIHGLSSPFLVSLKFSFQTPEKLFLVVDYFNGGELFYHLQQNRVFPEEVAKFFVAEITCALEFLHGRGIAYRDLKPENLLLDSNGHIVLTDFGLSKDHLVYGQQTNTYCGTAAYLAPEVLIGNGYDWSVDWWSLGIVFYEMMTGLPPFFSENVNLMYTKILHDELLFPGGFSKEAQSFISALVERNRERRLGAGHTDALELKQHPYFSRMDWVRLERKQLTPPYKPRVESEADATNFDPEFTSMMPDDDSLPNNSQPLSTYVQRQFQGFTFEQDESQSAFPNSVRSVRLED